MCIIAVCEKRFLTKDEFNSCWNTSPDGVGFAYMSGGKVFATKGLMNKNKAWKRYKKIPVIPHVIHFRIGTSGDVCRELTHPFVVSPRSDDFAEYNGRRPILFHNGVIYGWESDFLSYLVEGDISYKGKMRTLSDTKALAIMLADKAKVIDEATLDVFTKELPKSSGKYAIIFPEYGEHGTTATIGEFIKDNGVHFSNSTYKWSYNLTQWGSKYDCYGATSDTYGDLFGYEKRDERRRGSFEIPKPNSNYERATEKKWEREKWYRDYYGYTEEK
jgi:hypothetical protein